MAAVSGSGGFCKQNAFYGYQNYPRTGARTRHYCKFTARAARRCAIPRWRWIGSKSAGRLREPAALSSMIAERIEGGKANARKDYQRALDAIDQAPAESIRQQ